MRTIEEVHAEQLGVLQTMGKKEFQRDTLARELAGLCARIRVLEDEAAQILRPNAPEAAQEQHHE